MTAGSGLPPSRHHGHQLRPTRGGHALPNIHFHRKVPDRPPLRVSAQRWLKHTNPLIERVTPQYPTPDFDCKRAGGGDYTNYSLNTVVCGRGWPLEKVLVYTQHTNTEGSDETRLSACVKAKDKDAQLQPGPFLLLKTEEALLAMCMHSVYLSVSVGRRTGWNSCQAVGGRFAPRAGCLFRLACLPGIVAHW